VAHRDRTNRRRGGSKSAYIERLLDAVGWDILTALQDNARLSFSELGRREGTRSEAAAQ
jgi:hypothetical protein